MSGDYLIIVLALTTFVVAIGVALRSRQATKRKLDSENRPKSSLAKDGPGPQPFR